MATKNIFANIGADDSDDDLMEKKPLNKTQKKKEERKVDAKPLKINANKMAEGGFEVNIKDGKGQQRGGDRPQTGRGRGDGGPRGRGDRGHRGDRGGPRGRGGPRPRTGVTRLDAEGNPVVELDKRPREGFQGKTRGDHPYDKHSGYGRGTRKPAERKGGHGKGNWGDRPEAAHKRGKPPAEGDDANQAQAQPAEASALAEAEDKPEKVEKAEEEKVPESEKVVEEIIGVSLDDFLKTKTFKAKAQARQSEGIKDAKVEALGREKEKQSTLLMAKDVKKEVGRAQAHELLGFQAGAEDDE